ncbi:CD3072 family TudS-related putative desulfidase [Desulfobaculum bizertense]|uniref:Predicted secreted protein n=1 Tax=Desulfobaculum bizertense DSM 18034 TaxID=1121442 RepID=A0A1T4W4Y0_9BACT|nr:CD3072 family TudS-related putative desulfidase [Desulfobaculum bizertense]SKA72302.1 Predicted secreted protein [Desulfobaculum bizertense DSM 18034]
MKRSRSILVVCHCLLNSNAKIYPLAATGGVYTDSIQGYVDKGAGLVQLPCPETCALGMKRWGMTYEQYDTPAFRDFCKELLKPSLLQIRAFHAEGYKILGVAGTDGSPNCGIAQTCSGYVGGNVTPERVAAQCSGAGPVAGKGVFMELLQEELQSVGIDVPFFSLVAEDDATDKVG